MDLVAGDTTLVGDNIEPNVVGEAVIGEAEGIASLKLLLDNRLFQAITGCKLKRRILTKRKMYANPVLWRSHGFS